MRRDSELGSRRQNWTCAACLQHIGSVNRILEIAAVVPIELELIRGAIEFQKTRNLSLQDSIVYASVLSHLSTAPAEESKCFITKNSKDFANPDIYTELKPMVASF